MRMTFILLQLLLRQCEHLFTHQSRHRDFNPLRARPLMPTNVATGESVRWTERGRDALPGPLLGFAKASRSPIRGIAQHAPNRGSLPAAFAHPCRNLAVIQHTSDGVDAEPLLRIDLKHHSHHLGLGLHHLVRMPPRCRSSSRIGSRKALRKARSPRPDAPCASCLAGTARRSGRVRIRRSCPETAAADDLPAWLPPAPSERSTRLRNATVPRSTRLDRRTFGLADPASRPAPRRSGPPPPDRAAPLIPAAPGWLRYSLRPGIPIPAVRCIRSSVRIRSAPPFGWRWCDSPSGDPRTRAHKWLLACSSFTPDVGLACFWVFPPSC